MPDMTMPEILSSLEFYTGKFPEEAMRAAMEQREAITPELLRVLQAVADDAPNYAPKTNYMLHLYALYLLAQFREKRAYPIVLKLISWPGEKTVEDLLCDTVTEGLPSILASVYDGNLEGLMQVALNDQAYCFVRSSVMDAIVVLYFEHLITREQIVSAFRRFYQELKQEGDPQPWNGLVSSTADAGLTELLPEMREAFAKGLVDEMCTDLEYEEKKIRERQEARVEGIKCHYRLIENAIDEMSWWAAFDEEENEPPGLDELEDDEEDEPLLPLPHEPFQKYIPPPPPQTVRLPAKVGRNDPCPCGSGKKYKKCCLRS